MRTNTRERARSRTKQYEDSRLELAVSTRTKQVCGMLGAFYILDRSEDEVLSITPNSFWGGNNHVSFSVALVKLRVFVS